MTEKQQGSSGKFAKNMQLPSFFSALFLLLIGSGPKRSMPIENWEVLGWFLPYFKEKENCTSA